MVAIPSTFVEARAVMDAAREKNKTKAGHTPALSKRRRELLKSMGLKRCSQCLAVRDRPEFPSNKSAADGLHYRCRMCSNRNGAEYRAANPEAAKKYYAAKREAAKEYYAANREARLAYGAEYRADPLNRLQRALNHGRRRAAKRGLPAQDIRVEDFINHLESVGESITHSYLTGVEIPLAEVSIDHVIPLSNPNSPGHVLTNIRPCTWPENDAKGKRTPEEYLALKENT